MLQSFVSDLFDTSAFASIKGRRIGGGSTVSAAPAPLAQPRVTENRITFDWSRKLDSIENLSGLCEC